MPTMKSAIENNTMQQHSLLRETRLSATASQIDPLLSYCDSGTQTVGIHREIRFRGTYIHAHKYTLCASSDDRGQERGLDNTPTSITPSGWYWK